MTSTERRVALVTGAGSGLGEATAHALANAGYAVACLDRDGEAVRRVSGELVAEGIAVTCDMGDSGNVAEGIQAVQSRFGRIDVAVSCAGVDYVRSLEELTIEQWNRVLSVDLSGPFYLAKALFPLMRAQGGGDIINVASTAATRAWANASAYHAAKWGLRGFTRALGVEGRAYGIRATLVIPGGMKTHWFDRFPEEGIPMPEDENLQDPGNVAKAIVFAAQMPAESIVQEVMVTPLTETSWP